MNNFIKVGVAPKPVCGDKEVLVKVFIELNIRTKLRLLILRGFFEGRGKGSIPPPTNLTLRRGKSY